jgi:hypothetical protein
MLLLTLHKFFEFYETCESPSKILAKFIIFSAWNLKVLNMDGSDGIGLELMESWEWEVLARARDSRDRSTIMNRIGVRQRNLSLVTLSLFWFGSVTRTLLRAMPSRSLIIKVLFSSNFRHQLVFNHIIPHASSVIVKSWSDSRFRISNNIAIDHLEVYLCFWTSDFMNWSSHFILKTQVKIWIF